MEASLTIVWISHSETCGAYDNELHEHRCHAVAVMVYAQFPLVGYCA